MSVQKSAGEGAEPRSNEPGAAVRTQSIIGTYRLINLSRIPVDTGKPEESFGSNPEGYIMYGSDGRMMVLMLEADRPRTSYAAMTDADRIRLFNTMVAYAGVYTYDGDIVTHHVDVSSNGIFTGTILRRRASFEGNRLLLTSEAAPAPRDGRMSVNTALWERVPQVLTQK